MAKKPQPQPEIPPIPPVVVTEPQVQLLHDVIDAIQGALAARPYETAVALVRGFVDAYGLFRSGKEIRPEEILAQMERVKQAILSGDAKADAALEKKFG